MTQVSSEEFLNKLLDVSCKLSNIAKTQTYRFKNKWDDYLKPLNKKPHLIRQIPIDKAKFVKDIEYRIKVLKNVEQAAVDGFHTIKTLLQTLYGSYFDSELFLNDFSNEDQIILKYLVAKEILGNLIQYNILDHESVPLKYNIIARNYTLIKLKGQIDTAILDSMKKLKINELKLADVIIYMEEVKADGIINIKKEGKNSTYELRKELELTKEGKVRYMNCLAPLIDWPTGFWRSFYNIRELNVTPDKDFPYRDFLVKTLSKSATQGYGPTSYVFKNLIKYYEKVRED